MFILLISIFFRAAGSLVVMDPNQICRKSRRLRGKLADICRNEHALLKHITNGVLLGQRECQYQFRHRRWNCTSTRRSMRKVLLRGKRAQINKIRALEMLRKKVQNAYNLEINRSYWNTSFHYQRSVGSDERQYGC